jgi:4-amino-4-deoxy-L-arabinose transferase-like glycosyltransferase
MKTRDVVLFVFILFKFLLQYLLISPEYDLQRDEYLHLDMADHLAWGYLSVPPLTSWNSYLIKLLGNSAFWVKFFPALFGALTIVVVWKAIEELKGGMFALVLGATGVLFSVLLRLNTLYQPNSFDVLAWTAFYFVVLKYVNTNKNRWLFIGAVIFALGFLNKYNIAFLLIGMLPALVLTEHRKVLDKKNFYFALLLAFVLVLPNLLWQYQNGFPVVHHLRQLSELHLVNVERWGFMKAQLFFFVGSLIVLSSGMYALLTYRPFQSYRLFFWSFFFTLFVFLYFKAKDYYAIGLYPIYIAFGAVYLEEVLERRQRIYLKSILLVLPLLFFIPLYLYVFPNRSPEYIQQHSETYRALGLLRWEDGKDHVLPQDFADMLGWSELAAKVDSVYSQLSPSEPTLVLCDNYGQAGAINYYSRQGIKAVSFNADYINWFDLDPQYVNLIRVKSGRDQRQELEETGAFFQQATVGAAVTNIYAREYGTTIFLFTGAKIDINARIREEIAAERSY